MKINKDANGIAPAAALPVERRWIAKAMERGAPDKTLWTRLDEPEPLALNPAPFRSGLTQATLITGAAGQEGAYLAEFLLQPARNIRFGNLPKTLSPVSAEQSNDADQVSRKRESINATDACSLKSIRGTFARPKPTRCSATRARRASGLAGDTR